MALSDGGSSYQRSSGPRLSLTPPAFQAGAVTDPAAGGQADNSGRESDARLVGWRLGSRGAGAPREPSTAETAGSKDRQRAVTVRVATRLRGPRSRSPGYVSQPRPGGPAPLRPGEGSREGRRRGPPPAPAPAWSPSRARPRPLPGEGEKLLPGAEKPVCPVGQSGGEEDCRRGRAHRRGAGGRRGALGEPREPEESRPTGRASRGPRPARCAMQR